MADDSPCKVCGGTGTNAYYGIPCGGCNGSGLRTNPKFRAECECGAKQPRLTTAYTAGQWMYKHLATAHRYDSGDAPL